MSPTHSREARQHCPYCDDTGNVHDQTGEWRGLCTCPAGADLTLASSFAGEDRDQLQRGMDERQEQR